MALTLDQLNNAPAGQALAWLDGLYEHSPWIAEAALAQRPFASLAALKWALVRVLDGATLEQQLALIRAHPELAGKAMVAKSLTAESTNEQTRAGLTHCTPEEFERIQRLNRDYNARFGFPFILAVRGPRGCDRRLRAAPSAHVPGLRRRRRACHVRPRARRRGARPGHWRAAIRGIQRENAVLPGKSGCPSGFRSPGLTRRRKVNHPRTHVYVREAANGKCSERDAG